MTNGGVGDGERDRDADLMARVVEGDDAAFEMLVRRTMRRALTVAQAMVGDAAEADEIAQEAFMRVWRHAERWDPGKARFTTWLHRIVINLCLDRRRKPVWLPIEAAGDIEEGGLPAPDRIEARQRQEAVRDALAAIPARQRAAVALFYFDGMSGQAAADVLGISRTAFEQLLLRARRAVKAELIRRGLATAEGGLS